MLVLILVMIMLNENILEVKDGGWLRIILGVMCLYFLWYLFCLCVFRYFVLRIVLEILMDLLKLMSIG